MLSGSLAKINGRVKKLKKDSTKQNQYVDSLELDCEHVKKASKQQRSDIQELQESLNNIPVKTVLKFMAFQRM